MIRQLAECLPLVTSITKEKVLVILNADFSDTTKQMIDELSKLDQVDSIFLLGNDESTLADFPKASRFATFDQAMTDVVRQRIRTAIKTAVEISMFDQTKQNTTRDLTKHMAGFLWFQMLLHVLRQLRGSEQSKNDMLDMCASYYRMQEDQTELEAIEEYRKTYSKEHAIHWYTRDCFLYKLLNKALRTEDVRSLLAFRTFIVDLCGQIDDLHQQRIAAGDKETMILYRGQHMTKREQAQLLVSQGQLISTNGFISATKELAVAAAFALRNRQSADLVPVVFRIAAPATLKNVTFADIARLSAYQGEAEILFSLGAAFRIEMIEEQQAGGNTCTIVYMTATDQGHESVTRYIDSLKAEFQSVDRTIILGRLLMDMGRYKESDDYFTDLIDYTRRHVDDQSLELAPLYHNKGRARASMGDLKEALELMIQAQKIHEHHACLKTPALAQTLNSIGVLEGELGRYQQAQQNFEQALYVFQQPDSNPASANSQLQIATAKSNIGWVLYLRGNYDESLKYHIEAFEIRKGLLPDGHALIADSLNSVGALYHVQGQYDDAKKLYTNALMMRQQTLPARHPSIASSCLSLGNLELENGQQQDACQFFETARAIYTENFGEDHSLVGSSVKALGTVFLENAEYDKALEYFETARQILTRNLSERHPSVGECYHFSGIAHERKTLHKQAIRNYEKALEIFSNYLAVDHPAPAKIFVSMANTYMRTREYNRAEMNLQRALFIQEKAYANQHPDLVLTLNNFGVLYTQMREYDKAKDYFTRALNMCRRCYPASHIASARTLFNLGEVHAITGAHDTAIPYYKEAIDIQEVKLPRTNFCVIDTHNRIAEAYMKLNRFIEAQQHLMQNKNRYEENNYTTKNAEFARVMRNLKTVSKSAKRR